MWSKLAALSLLVGCVRAQLVDCGDGTVCPNGTLCDANHQTCIAPTQLEACVGLAESSPCTYDGIPGTCIGNVCFGKECGDRVIEPGEMCDDGNRLSDDGCSADCRSDETCGNGVQDEREDCDDANLRSADGCDSRCVRESLSWGVISCGTPQYFSASTTTFDTDRGVVVTVVGRIVYEWDGSSWRCSLSPDSVSSLVYDARRKVSVAVREVTTTVQELLAWDGTTWTRQTVVPDSRIRGLAFRGASMELVAVLDTGVASFDPVADSWRTESATGPPTIYRLIFDEANDQLVGQAGSTIWRWSFSARIWDSGPPVPGVSVPTIMYVADQSRVQAYAGDELWEWTGLAGNWVRVAGSTLTPTRSSPAMVRLGSRTLVLGGGPQEIVEWNGATWSVKSVTGALPTISAPAAIHPETGDLISFGTQATYALRGSFWEALPATTVLPLATGVHLTSDPGQRRLVALLVIGGITETWTFTSSWQRLAIPAFPGLASSVLYDPDRAAVVALGDDVLYALGSSGWTMVVAAPTEFAKQNLSGLAHDPSNRCLIAGNAFATYELCSGTSVWTFLLTTIMGTYYVGVEDPNRASMFLVHPRGGAITWERKGTSWEASPTAPQTLDIFGILYDPDRHVIAFPGRNGLTWTLGYRSATPLESCAPGEDADGDGVAGCDDGDCWWSCTPACPPSASCP